MERRPNVIGILGLAAIIAAYVLHMEPVSCGIMWTMGMIAGFIGLFRPGRLWGALAVFVGLVPMVIVFVWFGYNYEQLVADGYFGEVQTEVVAQGNDTEAALAEPDEPARQWIEIPSPRGGYVEVYIGMSGDEVKKLIGRPKKVKADTFGKVLQEEWRYDLPGYSWMTMDFENGVLTSISQY